MKHASKRFKSLKIALKELEPFIRDGKHLQTGRPFKAMHGLLSREGLANWLICAVFNSIAKKEQLTFATVAEEIGGDGLLLDTTTGETWPTEHVMVPNDDNDKRDIQNRVVEAIRDKQEKGGEQYARGKTLIVFMNAGNSSEWWPNRVAKAVPQPVLFGAIWIVGLHAVENGEYHYNVSEIDTENGVGHIWRVRIAASFDEWSVSHVHNLSANEKALATIAKERFIELLHRGSLDLTEIPCSCPAETINTKACNDGRKCGVLTLNGKNIGETLIAEELAVSYKCAGTTCPRMPNWRKIIDTQFPSNAVKR